jgi:uroporphyrinogen-III synthase
LPAVPARPPLSGRVIVVTRAAEQAGELVGQLGALGADVVEAPCLTITLLPAASTALAACSYDWVVATSPNGIAAIGATSLGGARLAVVGPGTAQAAAANGHTVSFVAPEARGASLVARFPIGRGRVLVAQGDRAGAAVADGLRARGWTVDAVVAYRNDALGADPAVIAQLSTRVIDLSVFLSGSAVRAFVDGYGRWALGEAIVCIGPSTAAACAALSVPAAAIVVANPHTLDGVVAAVSDALGAR